MAAIEEKDREIAIEAAEKVCSSHDQVCTYDFAVNVFLPILFHGLFRVSLFSVIVLDSRWLLVSFKCELECQHWIASTCEK